MFKHVMNERYGGVQAVSSMRKQQMLIKEGNTKRVKNIVKAHQEKEDAMLKWNMKQSLIRTTNDVSAKLKAVRFATAVVAKLDAKILADRLAMEDSLSKANEVGMRDNNNEEEDDDAEDDEDDKDKNESLEY
mgnify:CR=1 FL=1